MDAQASIEPGVGFYSPPWKNLEELKSLMHTNDGAPLIHELNTQFYPLETLKPLLAYVQEVIPYPVGSKEWWAFFRLMVHTKSFTPGVMTAIEADMKANKSGGT
jgi:hypothetical protein